MAFLPTMALGQGLDIYPLWQHDKGTYRIKLSEWWFVSDSHFDHEGHVIDNFVEYGHYATQMDLEFGLSDRLTARLSFPFLNYLYTQLPASLQKRSAWKTGDADVGASYKVIFNNTLQMRVALTLGLPLGYNEQEAIKSGDGEFNQVLQVELGHNGTMWQRTSWWGLHAGWNNRNEGFATEFVYGGEAGIEVVKDKLNISVRVNGIDPIGKVNISPIVEESLYSNLRKLIALTPEVSFQINPLLGVKISQQIPLAGRNIFFNPIFAVGVEYQKKIGRSESLSE